MTTRKGSMIVVFSVVVFAGCFSQLVLGYYAGKSLAKQEAAASLPGTDVKPQE